MMKDMAMREGTRKRERARTREKESKREKERKKERERDLHIQIFILCFFKPQSSMILLIHTCGGIMDVGGSCL